MGGSVMSAVCEMLSSLRLPAFLSENACREDWAAIRQNIIRTLLCEEYGVIPDMAAAVQGCILQEERDFCAGKCVLKTAEITARLPQGECRFPVQLAMPAASGLHPLFVCINFRPGVPDRYLPAEEIIDRGYAVLSIDYNAVSPDRDDGFADGPACLLRRAAAESGVKPGQLPGKIAVWAWAMSRALDWALTQPGVCHERIAAIGHSRLGKTALLAGLLDERFACVISNDSGCSGAAVTRGKPGEHVADITRQFPFWFCQSYQKYAGREDAMPFDQHWLLAGIAPRMLLVGSAWEDEWAGPSHEYLGCCAASAAWTLTGKPGFVHPDRLPTAGDVLHEGCVGYHLRAGRHYLSREDWNRYMDFLDAKGWTKR